jgi:uncharacterized protein YecE (DUF72 family)
MIRMAGKLYLGSMGWSYGFWGLYRGLKPEEYLGEYARRFNSVEINSTFYRIPRRETVESWAAAAPEGFVFSAKFPRSISHSPGLRYPEGKLDAFISNMELLGSKMGPLLLQLPPRFKPDEAPALTGLLSTLPVRHRYAVELRDRAWMKEESLDTLTEQRVCVVQQEHPWLPSIDRVTGGYVYIRLEGDRRKVSGEKGTVERDASERNLHWAHRIREYLESFDVYCYVSKYYSGYPPRDVEHIKKELC